jgi:dGTPase
VPAARIISRLEKYYSGEGIRPTRRLLLGVLKYPVPYSKCGDQASRAKPPKCFYDDDLPLVEAALQIFTPEDQERFCSVGIDGKPAHKTFDCSIMELADDIAYGVHDLEDGIGRGLLRRSEIEESLRKGLRDAGVESIRDVSVDELIDKLFSQKSWERKHAISLLVGYFILAVTVTRQGVFESPLLDLQATVEPATRTLLTHLSKNITYTSIVSRREVQTLEYKGEKIVGDLFDAFCERPLLLIGRDALDPLGGGAAEILAQADSERQDWRELEGKKQTVARAICDYIAGMTNPFAEKYHRRLFEPGFGSSTDELEALITSDECGNDGSSNSRSASKRLYLTGIAYAVELRGVTLE